VNSDPDAGVHVTIVGGRPPWAVGVSNVAVAGAPACFNTCKSAGHDSVSVGSDGPGADDPPPQPAVIKNPKRMAPSGEREGRRYAKRTILQQRFLPAGPRGDAPGGVGRKPPVRGHEEDQRIGGHGGNSTFRSGPPAPRRRTICGAGRIRATAVWRLSGVRPARPHGVSRRSQARNGDAARQHRRRARPHPAAVWIRCRPDRAPSPRRHAGVHGTHPGLLDGGRASPAFRSVRAPMHACSSRD